MAGLTALQRLARMGFDRDAAMKMAKAEHENWCRYYRRNHWKYGAVRNDEHRIHNKLVDWSAVEADEELLNTAVESLAATLWSLRQLGYRSRPVWQQFTRVGTVNAEQRNTPWTWTSRSGQHHASRRRRLAGRRRMGPRGRCATTSSRPAMSTSRATNGEVAAMFPLDRRSRARRSPPWRDQRPPPTATGWCEAPTVRNGPFPPHSSRSGIPPTNRATPSTASFARHPATTL